MLLRAAVETQEMSPPCLTPLHEGSTNPQGLRSLLFQLAFDHVTGLTPYDCLSVCAQVHIKDRYILALDRWPVDFMAR